VFPVIVQRNIIAYLARHGSLLMELTQPMNRLIPAKSAAVKLLLRRLDRVAADLNILLIVIAVGLATLDLTFLVTQKVVEHLPPITRIPPHAAPPGGPG
jgi:hypothetical protein